MDESESAGEVWVVLEGSRYQGYEIRGVFSSHAVSLILANELISKHNLDIEDNIVEEPTGFWEQFLIKEVGPNQWLGGSTSIKIEKWNISQ